MKKVINGKMYSTETANTMISWDNGYHINDFQYCEETLYRTDNGTYFLYGNGGPMSKYVVCAGVNEFSGSAVIVALTEDEARKWAEERASGEEYEEVFGPVPEA